MCLPFKLLHLLFDFHQTWYERYAIGVLTNNIQSDIMPTVSNRFALTTSESIWSQFLRVLKIEASYSPKLRYQPTELHGVSKHRRLHTI
jgi:hypothetical protein